MFIAVSELEIKGLFDSQLQESKMEKRITEQRHSPLVPIPRPPIVSCRLEPTKIKCTLNCYGSVLNYRTKYGSVIILVWFGLIWFNVVYF